MGGKKSIPGTINIGFCVHPCTIAASTLDKLCEWFNDTDTANIVLLVVVSHIQACEQSNQVTCLQLWICLYNLLSSTPITLITVCIYPPCESLGTGLCSSVTRGMRRVPQVTQHAVEALSLGAIPGSDSDLLELPLDLLSACIAAQNSSDRSREERCIQHIVVPEVLPASPPLSMLLSLHTVSCVFVGRKKVHRSPYSTEIKRGCEGCPKGGFY